MKKRIRLIHKSKEDALSDEQIKKLIEAVESSKETTLELKNKKLREKLIILTLTYTGLRADELAHLRENWIDWKEDHIKIPIKMECNCQECINNRNRIWQPKTKAGIRFVPIIKPKLREVLREYFTNNKELGMTRSNIWYVVKKIGKRAGINKIYPHSLRATASTIFAHLVSAPTLKIIMGWEDLEVAESYVKSDTQRAMEEIRKIKQGDEENG